MTAEGIEQRAMRCGVEQAAIVRLAVNLDEKSADLARELQPDRLIVDEGACCVHRPKRFGGG